MSLSFCHVTPYVGYNLLCAGINRTQFDNKVVAFEEHVKKEHNMWDYLKFIVLLKVKDPTEFTGPESYVYYKIQVWGRDG